MRIGLQAPRKKGGGAETFEQELFQGLVTGVAETPHTLVAFSRQPCPAELVDQPRFEWVRVRGIGGRDFAATVRRLVNRGCNDLLRWPSPFRNEHWIDGPLHHHRVEFFVNLIPETMPTEIPYLMFVWDLMHRVLPFFPECSQRGAWVRREAWLRTMVQRAAILGVGTETGRREVMQFYQVPEARIHVLPFPTPRFALGADAAPAAAPISESARIGGDYVFYPANFHGHKNHVTLLHALALLRDRHGTVLHAAFSGADWGNLAHVRDVVARLKLEPQVHFLGFVSRADLIALYRGARALVFPSLLGPDNLPPLEAFGLGCPALVAEIPGAAEQTQGAALLFPPTDETALADAILRVHRDEELRRGLIERGRVRAAQFTSEALGRRLLQLIGEFEKVRRCWPAGTRYPSRYNLGRLFGG